MVKPSSSIDWPANSQRSLVEWVDEHGGPQSDLILDNKKAIRDLRDHLVNHRHNYDFGKKGLPMAEVRRKLEALWKDRLSKHKTAPIDVFYNEGSIALDWHKLDTRPIHGDYADDEIQEFQDRAMDNSGTSANASGDDVGGGMANADGRSGRPEKRRRLGQEASTQDQPDSEEADAIGAPQPQADVGPGSSQRNVTTSNTEHVPFWIPNYSSERITMLDVASVARSAQSKMDGPAFQFGRFQQSSAPDFVPAHIVQIGINTMFESIYGIIYDFLRATVTDVDQPVFLDEDQILPTRCAVLLNGMLGNFGARGAYGGARRSKVFAAFNQTQAKLDDFLKSLVGIALTEWCLQWRLNEEQFYLKLVDGNVKRVFEGAFDSLMLSEMRWRLWQQHMTRTVQPTIQGKAWVMAAQLEAFMSLFLPPGKVRLTSILDTHVVSAVDAPDPWKSTSPPSQLAFDISPPLAKVRTRLAELFTIALTWRTEMALSMNEEMYYRWLCFMEPYKRNDVSFEAGRIRSGRDAQFDSDADDSVDPRVLLCLRPIISRKTRQNMRDHNWTEARQICDGHLVRLRVRPVDQPS